MRLVFISIQERKTESNLHESCNLIKVVSKQQLAEADGHRICASASMLHASSAEDEFVVEERSTYPHSQHPFVLLLTDMLRLCLLFLKILLIL